MPILSVMRDAMGEKKKIMPTQTEPTQAVIFEIKETDKHFIRNIQVRKLMCQNKEMHCDLSG